MGSWNTKVLRSVSGPKVRLATVSKTNTWYTIFSGGIVNGHKSLDKLYTSRTYLDLQICHLQIDHLQIDHLDLNPPM